MSILLGLLLTFVLICWRLDHSSRNDCAQKLSLANERVHEIANSCLRGHPLIKWKHPSPTPASDHWYWRVRFEGLEYLFTEEAMKQARQRAELLIVK